LLFGSFSIDSLGTIRDANRELDAKFYEASKLEGEVHPSEVERFSVAADEFERVRELYQIALDSAPAGIDLRTLQVETYRIDFLWMVIGQYAGTQGLVLTIDLTETQYENVYDLIFTVSGEYAGIANFIRNLENDNRLQFRIENFVIAPSSMFEQIADIVGHNHAEELPGEATAMFKVSEISILLD